MPNHENIILQIEEIIFTLKRNNRIPQHFELSQSSYQRLINAVENMFEAKAEEQYIGGFIVGFITGFGHLFDQMTQAFKDGMIKRVRDEQDKS